MDLKNLSNEEIVKLFKEGKIGIKDIVDSGICPTCFNKENNNYHQMCLDEWLYEMKGEILWEQTT